MIAIDCLTPPSRARCARSPSPISLPDLPISDLVPISLPDLLPISLPDLPPRPPSPIPLPGPPPPSPSPISRRSPADLPPISRRSQASTAIAYLSDKAEARPGSPNSTLTSIEDPAALTKTKLRFHQKQGSSPGKAAAGSGAAAAAALAASSSSEAADEEAASSSMPPAYPTEEPDDTPGARSKAMIGLMPKAKVSATHDSKTKLSRSVQERTETYGRRLTVCSEPANMEDPYEEIPSPLPSPRDY